LLEEQDQLTCCIVAYQNRGQANKRTQHQHGLHRNLIYFATITDPPQNMPSPGTT
uniref:SS18 N-terminal domain-containing protein n=1 Tax=Piliocolobus tephrosceles TaxID=591936 RepID=A0A8C9H6T4_9PRIM